MAESIPAAFKFARSWAVTGPRLRTASRPLVGVVDGQPAVLKGNHVHSRSALDEIICTALAQCVGCPIPEWRVIELTREQPIDDGECIWYKGMIFASLMVPDVIENPSAGFVMHFVELGYVDPADLAAIWVFGLWTLNASQLLFHIPKDGPSRGRVYAIDHQITSLALSAVRFRTTRLVTDGPTRPDLNSIAIHLPAMSWTQLTLAYARLSGVSEGDIERILAAVPADRGLSPSDLLAMQDFLVKRARFLGARGLDILRRSRFAREIGTT